LLESGYKMCLFDGLNRFYVDSSDSELAAAISSPASVIDNFERAAVHEMSVRFAELVHAEAERAQAEAHRAQAEADQAQAEINVGLLRTRVEELSRKLAENIERQRTLTMEIDRRDVLLEDSSIRVETLDQEISLARNHELALEAALTAIEQTKVFRYSRGLRHVYGLFLRR
jgi:chromosome segregation ATPase